MEDDQKPFELKMTQKDSKWKTTKKSKWETTKKSKWKTTKKMEM